jgi:DNA-binding transcriptional ArsR family regulator
MGWCGKGDHVKLRLSQFHPGGSDLPFERDSFDVVISNRVSKPRARWELEMKVSRQEAAQRCVAVFDTGFFKALCEPARIAVLRELILLGRSDIGAIADRLPQDRSVVARHLQQLAAAHVVKFEREGRHVFYDIDARAVAERLEGILAITRMLEAAIGAGRIPKPRKPKAPVPLDR